VLGGKKLIIVEHILNLSSHTRVFWSTEESEYTIFPFDALLRYKCFTHSWVFDAEDKSFRKKEE
jgi:hypothetical protein